MGVKNIAYINKEMLIWARNETPFATVEDVEAHSSSISAEKLYKWESGEDLPSVNEAKRLASIYKVPFACFYLSEIPEKKPKPYTDRRTALGTSYDVISYDLWSEIQRIVSNRECLIEFTEEDDILPIPPVSDTSIEGIAKQIREFLELNTPLKNKTAYGYKRRVSGKMAKYFDEKITLADCKPRLIHGFYDYLREDGDSEQTILHYHNLLHTAFEYAIRQEILEYNPMDRVERPQPKKFVGDFYSVDEVKTLLEHAKEDVIYIPIVLAVYCGLRRSEALGLSWSNIDFENEKIFIGQKVLEVVRNGKMEQVVSDEMKTESSRRSFKMIPEVKEILLAHKAQQELYRQQFRRAYSKKYLDMVCVNPLGELIKPSYITSHFPKLLKQYGMRDIRFHDLRHTCASLLVSLDVNMKVIQKYLGHSNMSTTADIYSHLDANATGEAGMKLGKLLSDDESEVS